MKTINNQEIVWDDQNLDPVGARVSKGLSDYGYAIVDNFLLPQGVGVIRAHMDQLFGEGQFKEAGVGAAHKFQVNRDIRKDWILWIDPQNTIASTQVFGQQMVTMMQQINRHCFLGLKDFEMHYALYSKNAYYQRHLDQFEFSDHRRLTFLCYLNPHWQIADGGLLRLYLRNQDGQEIPFDIAPLAGRLVIFRSDEVEHEVLLCKKQRYSLTGWMLDQLSELTFL